MKNTWEKIAAAFFVLCAPLVALLTLSGIIFVLKIDPTAAGGFVGFLLLGVGFLETLLLWILIGNAFSSNKS